MARRIPRAAVEFERRVRFIEMIVAADLHWPIAGIRNLDLNRCAASVHRQDHGHSERKNATGKAIATIESAIAYSAPGIFKPAKPVREPAILVTMHEDEPANERGPPVALRAGPQQISQADDRNAERVAEAGREIRNNAPVPSPRAKSTQRKQKSRSVSFSPAFAPLFLAEFHCQRQYVEILFVMKPASNLPKSSSETVCKTV